MRKEREERKKGKERIIYLFKTNQKNHRIHCTLSLKVWIQNNRLNK